MGRPRLWQVEQEVTREGDIAAQLAAGTLVVRKATRADIERLERECETRHSGIDYDSDELRAEGASDPIAVPA